MYNEKPEALMIAHRKLDEAVFAAWVGRLTSATLRFSRGCWR